MITSGPEARGPEEHDAPLEWRAPSDDMIHTDGVVWTMASSRIEKTFLASDPVGFIDWYPALSLRQSS